jgi:hypothetical protein
MGPVAARLLAIVGRRTVPGRIVVTEPREIS